MNLTRLVFLLLFVPVPFVLIAQEETNDRIQFYDDTEQMRLEILKHIPLGTSLEDAVGIVKKNKIKFTMSVDESFLAGNVVKEHIDYIYCDERQVGGLFIEKRWQIAIVHENGKVTEVLVSFGLIGP